MANACPVQVTGFGVHIIDVEREGDHRHATIEIFRGRGLGEIVRNNGEIGGNLHTHQCIASHVADFSLRQLKTPSQYMVIAKHD